MTDERRKIREDAINENHVKSVEVVNRVISGLREDVYAYLDQEKMSLLESEEGSPTVDIKGINAQPLLMTRAAAILMIRILAQTYGLHQKEEGK